MGDTYIPMLPSQPDEPQGPLTEAEDADLRRLNYMSQSGELSNHSSRRMSELRLRDRRRVVRPPVEFDQEARPQRNARFWTRLLELLK